MIHKMIVSAIIAGLLCGYIAMPTRGRPHQRVVASLLTGGGQDRPQVHAVGAQRGEELLPQGRGRKGALERRLARAAGLHHEVPHRSGRRGPACAPRGSRGTSAGGSSRPA